jgi:hypothetical protein
MNSSSAKRFAIWKTLPTCSCCDNGVSDCNAYSPCAACTSCVDSILAYRKAIRTALLAEITARAPRDLEPDNYDDGFSEGVNDANTRWRKLLTELRADEQTKPQKGKGDEEI